MRLFPWITKNIKYRTQNSFNTDTIQTELSSQKNISYLVNNKHSKINYKKSKQYKTVPILTDEY